MLTDKDRELAQKLISIRFHGYARIRLEKLKAEVLDEIVNVLAM